MMSSGRGVSNLEPLGPEPSNLGRANFEPERSPFPGARACCVTLTSSVCTSRDGGISRRP